MKPSNILIFPTLAAKGLSTWQPAQRTPETLDKICATIRETGLSDNAAAALAGVTSSQFASWRREDPEFARRLEAAREEFRNALLEQIRQARNADGSLNQQAQAWLRKNGY
jgi:hypothetical protein